MQSPDRDGVDLVVVSPLPWPGLWQRPQHLARHLAAGRALAGGRTFYVEPPRRSDVAVARVRSAATGGLTRLWLETPATRGTASGDPPGYDGAAGEAYVGGLRDLLDRHRRPRDVLLATPAGLDIGVALQPRVLAYDVLDDLPTLAAAAGGLPLTQRRALAEAVLVTTAGRSLHRSVLPHRNDAHLIPSGVDLDLLPAAPAGRRDDDRPVAGYLGPVDDRLDLRLLAELADGLPDWTIALVGPLGVESSALPCRDNLHYAEVRSPSGVPVALAGFDVGLLPLALTAATRCLVPTVTLEYLAAGLPVVSTRIADIVTDCTGLVHFADDAEGFARTFSQVVPVALDPSDRQPAPPGTRRGWTEVAADVERLIADVAGATYEGTAGSREAALSAPAAPGGRRTAPEGLGRESVPSRTPTP